MNIHLLDLLEGAKKAQGLTVIIDVYRAFSAACYAIESGTSRIIPVGSLERAFEIKKQHPSFKLVGERGGVMPEGFDFGNSPHQLSIHDLNGSTVVHTTSAGTQGIVNASHATEIITGAFVNAEAIVKYIQQQNPADVSLVSMGWGGTEITDEDQLCAAYIRDSLLGLNPDFEKIRSFLTFESKTEKFLDVHDRDSAPIEDFELCLAVNRFPFVLKVVPSESFELELEVIKID